MDYFSYQKYHTIGFKKRDSFRKKKLLTPLFFGYSSIASSNSFPDDLPCSDL